MGDRGNVLIVERNGGTIYLYTHWGGSSLPSVLQSALLRGSNRWDDESYLTRIIFSEMIKDEVMSETGYGISTYQTDSNHDDLIVNMFNQTVSYGGMLWTFNDFCNAKFTT